MEFKVQEIIKINFHLYTFFVARNLRVIKKRLPKIKTYYIILLKLKGVELEMFGTR